MKNIFIKDLYSVYAIRCNKNNKIYIGVSKNPSARIEQHFSELRKGQKTRKTNRYHAQQQRDYSDWQNDFDKYGEESFDVHILETNIDYLRAPEKEAFYIAMYNSSDARFGYNLYSERHKLKKPLNFKPPTSNDEIFRNVADLTTLSVELKTLVDSISENYGGNDDYVIAFIMHLQRISMEFSDLSDKLFEIAR